MSRGRKRTDGSSQTDTVERLKHTDGWSCLSDLSSWQAGTSVCLGAKGVLVANISGSVVLGISKRQETLLALF